jgi:hypothetical protein
MEEVGLAKRKFRVVGIGTHTHHTILLTAILLVLHDLLATLVGLLNPLLLLRLHLLRVSFLKLRTVSPIMSRTLLILVIIQSLPT